MSSVYVTYRHMHIRQYGIDSLYGFFVFHYIQGCMLILRQQEEIQYVINFDIQLNVQLFFLTVRILKKCNEVRFKWVVYFEPFEVIMY